MSQTAFQQDTQTPQVSVSSQQVTYPAVSIRWAIIGGLALLLLFVFLLSLAIGSVSIPLEDIIKILMGSEPAKETWSNIVINFRLPKALTAVLAGAALAISGLQMQTFFRNPLAEPFVLGINAGASLGVALVVLAAGTGTGVLLAGLGLIGDLGLVISAAAGAALSLILVLLVAWRMRNNMTLLILGLMFGYAISAFVSLLLHFSIAERIRAYINWTLGSFGGVTWAQMQVFAPAILIGLGLSLLIVKPLNALLLGETYARSMGLNIRRARFSIISSTAILSGAVTAFCGPIGFIGIAVPHFCRSLFSTSDHRILVPAVIITGAVCALIADLIAQVPGSQIILPLNAVTALIGAPVVIMIVVRRGNLRSVFAS